MTRGPAQAGNRASRTGRYLQWWDTGPECNAVTPAVCKVHDSTLIPLASVPDGPCAKWRAKHGKCRVSADALTVAILAQGTFWAVALAAGLFSPCVRTGVFDGLRAQLVRAIGKRIPFGDHPLKLERYRED